MSYRLTSNYMPGTIQLFEIERFDIKQRERITGIQGVDDVDAVTSFELEAQRRRETVASDRWNAGWARAEATLEPVETAGAVGPALLATGDERTGRRAASAERKPAPATR